MIGAAGATRLERLAVEVPDLDGAAASAPDVRAAAAQARELGWRPVDRVVLRGRDHEIFDAAGLRIILVGPGPEPRGDGGADEARDG